MNEAKAFMSNTPFIIFFLLLALLFQITGGEKFLFGFLGLILLSMLVLNPAPFQNLVNGLNIGKLLPVNQNIRGNIT